ncbi:MAG TPA: nucleotide disphospho-sugar-binding domain-containing protein [Solirubrobacteraceae bacterium]
MPGSVGGDPLRIFLGAFGDPGHAFPMLALGSRLVKRGHEVTFETWTRWQTDVEEAGMHFVAAPEYPVFPTSERPLKPYEAVVQAAAVTGRSLRDRDPQIVVHDILTLAPALAGELGGLPVATLVPHVYPVGAPGLPPYALGARPARTIAGRAGWRAIEWPVAAGLRRGRDELNQARARLGLPPVRRLHGGLSERLCIVGTFPQLEYPRRWPESVHVVGPLLWEPPYHAVDPPAGAAPLVVVAPSTAQDSQQRLLRAAVAGLAEARVRILATWNRRPPPVTFEVPANTRLMDWISYSRSMPGANLVICHGGHGTLVRALASGVPVLVVPHSGDMAENAARADWAGVGVRLPWRLLGPRTIRWAVERALSDSSLAEQARGLARWADRHDGTTRAAELVEGLAAGDGVAPTDHVAASQPAPAGERLSARGARARTR